MRKRRETSGEDLEVGEETFRLDINVWLVFPDLICTLVLFNPTRNFRIWKSRYWLEVGGDESFHHWRQGTIGPSQGTIGPSLLRRSWNRWLFISEGCGRVPGRPYIMSSAHASWAFSWLPRPS